MNDYSDASSSEEGSRRKRRYSVIVLDDSQSQVDETIKKAKDVTDAYAETRETCKRFMRTYNDTKPEDRLATLNDRIEYFEAEIEIRIESLKIMLDNLNDECNQIAKTILSKLSTDYINNKLLKQIDNATHHGSSLANIRKCEKLCRVMNVFLTKQHRFRFISKSQHVQKKQVGSMYNYTPKYSNIWEAIKHGYYEDVLYMDYNPQDLNNILLKACTSGYINIVKYFLKQNANTNYYSSTGETPLKIACENGHLEVVKVLVQNKANVNSECALMSAAKNGHTRIVEFLMENKANANQSDYSKFTALMEATRGDYFDIARILIENRAKVNARDNLGNSVLAIAIVNSASLDMIQLLIDNNVDVNLPGFNRFTPLMQAAFLGRKDVVELLLQNKANVNDVNEDGQSALIRAACAAYRENVEMVNVADLLIEYKADVNMRDLEGGNTALIKASVNNRLDIVHSLLENGADVNVRNKSGETALYKACCARRVAIVKALVEHGADVDYKNKKGETLLIEAIMKSHFDIASILIDNNADVNAKTKDEKTALVLAIKKDGKGTIEKLIEKKANVNVHLKKQNNDTPLIIATKAGYVDIVELLLKNGADVNAKNRQGQSAASLVSKEDYLNIVVAQLINARTTEKS